MDRGEGRYKDIGAQEFMNKGGIATKAKPKKKKNMKRGGLASKK